MCGREAGVPENMSENRSENFGRLREAGVIVGGELPAGYARVIDELTPEQVDTIVDVKRLLDKAGAEAGRTPSETFTNFIVI